VSNQGIKPVRPLAYHTKIRMTLPYLPNDWRVLDQTSIKLRKYQRTLHRFWSHTQMFHAFRLAWRKMTEWNQERPPLRELKSTSCCFQFNHEHSTIHLSVSGKLRHTNHTTPVFVYSWLTQRTSIQDRHMDSPITDPRTNTPSDNALHSPTASS